MTQTASAPSLQDLARTGGLEEVERAWLAEMDSPLVIDRYLDALRALNEAGRGDRIGTLAAMLVEALDRQGRHKDVLATLERLVALGVPQIDGIDEICGRSLQTVYGGENWLPFLLSKAHGSPGRLTWQQFMSFTKLAAYCPGRAVLHRSGWGLGLVSTIHTERDEVEIGFASGRSHIVPWRSALETMDPLPDWDLRSMSLRDRGALDRLIAEQPLEVLRRGLQALRGRATTAQLKEFLHERIVPTKSWSGFWKKAKAAAVEDPLIAVEGSATRPNFTLRKKALKLVEEAEAALRHETSVERSLAVLRAFFARCTRDSDRDDLRRLAKARLASVAAAASHGADSVLAALFLNEEGQLSQEETIAIVRPFLGLAADGSGDLQLARLARITDVELRSWLAGLLPAVLHDGWQLRLGRHLTDLPEDCDESLEILVDELRQHGAADVLVELHDRVAPFPNKHPFLIYLLTRAWAEGDLGDRLDRQLALRVILHVLRLVSDTRAARAQRSRWQNRIVTILLGKRGLLQELLGVIDRRVMESIHNIARRGGEDFPPKVQELIERAAHERFPDLFVVSERPFWEDQEAILCTPAGLEARQAEFQNLRDVLIPENSKAIGAAASLGDLSENAEWEAAIEEQRTLTARATAWEDELRRAVLINHVVIPDGIVAPGTRVEFVDLDAQTTRSVRILGPWDAVLGDDVVSYRAPLAAGLLGRRAGDEVDVRLPNGQIRVRINGIEKLY
jgi:transcription elongation GreA/GreB family factor